MMDTALQDSSRPRQEYLVHHHQNLKPVFVHSVSCSTYFTFLKDDRDVLVHRRTLRTMSARDYLHFEIVAIYRRSNREGICRGADDSLPMEGIMIYDNPAILG